MMDSINIGLAGYGMIGRVHALAYREIPLFYPNQLPPINLASVCTSTDRSAQRAAREAQFASWNNDLAEMLSREEINVIDVCTPNHTHRGIALEGIRVGKDLLIEKPLALDVSEARQIAEAAGGARIRVGLVFNYRFVPAISHAKRLLDNGVLGRIYHFRFEYLHSGYANPNRPMSWKLRKEQAGGGALMDLGSHIIDLARFLLDEFKEVNASTRTFIHDRPLFHGATMRGFVNVEDAAFLHATLENGASGELMVSRFAAGSLDDLRFEIYGEKGALRFSLMDGNWLYLYEGESTPKSGLRGWKRIDTLSDYEGASTPPSRSLLSWSRTHAENIYQFLRATVQGQVPHPNLIDGLRVHEVIEAAYASALNGTWVSIKRSDN